LSTQKTVMISSAVYGLEPLLEQIYDILHSMGFKVWSSHMGTIPVDSTKDAFANCIDAAKKCDLFLGIITPSYGSGIKRGELGITHQEMQAAIILNKKRWFVAHHHVIFARKLLNDLLHADWNEFDSEGNKTKGPFAGVNGRKSLKTFNGSASIDDLRVIDMYEDATLQTMLSSDAIGNWVQKYESDKDIIRYITDQFSNHLLNLNVGEIVYE
jgi:hypothetical protein